MKLKHFGLLAMLGVLMWSCSDDSGIKSGDGNGQIRANLKANYGVTPSLKASGDAVAETEPISPEIADFSVRLTKKDGSYDKTWASVVDFPTDKKFPTGAYAMEITYGDEAVDGFERPYYYGSEEFQVIDDEVATPTIEAKLGNSMVSLSYTEAFKNYFASYSAQVRTANGSLIEYSNDETRPVYVKSGKVSFRLSLVKTNGVESTIEPAAISNAEPATHYRVTFDVNEGNVGDAVLSVTYDDTTEQEPIEVVLTDEVLSAPEPEAVAKGFENNATIDLIEGDEVSASVALVAQAGIKNVLLKVNSPYLESLGWAKEIDLMNVTDDQKALLQKSGLVVKGVWNNPDKMALVDFSELIPNLKPTGVNVAHSFSVEVVDVLGRTAESPIAINLNTAAVVFEMSNAQRATMGSLEGTFDFAFNGKMENVVFKTINDYGVVETATVKSLKDNKNGTYTVTLSIPDNMSSVTVIGYYRGEEKGRLNIPVALSFTLSANDYDVWATKATVKASSRIVSKVMSNVKAVYVNGTQTSSFTKDDAQNTFTVMGLTPGVQNTIKVVVDDNGYDCEASIALTTETAAQVGNAGFEEWGDYDWSFNHNGSLGGQSSPMKYYKPWNSSESDIWWDSNVTNSLRPSLTIGYTYFKCFPLVQYSTDCHGGSRSAQITVANVGNTNSIVMTTGTWYVGELFIGKGNDGSNGDWSRSSEGHSFPSRPTSLSFWYEYAPYGTDACSVDIQIKAADGTVIGSASASGDTEVSEWAEAVLPINYTVTNKKAATICISFKASTSSSHKCDNGGSYLEIAGSRNTGDKYRIKLSSVLRVDDIVLNY